MKLERILVPTDFSDLSERAAGIARSLAQASAATVHVLHVCEPVDVEIEAPEVGFLRRKVPADEAAQRQTLNEFAQRFFTDFGVPTVTATVSGKPAREIARYARDACIDRIVIGTHAKGIARRIFHGSVSKSVLEHAHCAVVMVPATALAPQDDRSDTREPWCALAAASCSTA